MPPTITLNIELDKQIKRDTKHVVCLNVLSCRWAGGRRYVGEYSNENHCRQYPTGLPTLLTDTTSGGRGSTTCNHFVFHLYKKPQTQWAFGPVQCVREDGRSSFCTKINVHFPLCVAYIRCCDGQTCCWMLV